MINKESYYLIKRKYDNGSYSLADMCDLVEKNIISREEFHFITDYSYKGIKETGIDK